MTAPAEVIEGQAKVVSESPAEERSLAVVPERQAHLSSGLGAIAAMSDEAFERNLALLTKAKVRAAQMQKALLTEGVDYGTVPGIPRPFLHKPGAETFEKAYGFATSYEIERKVGDGVKTPEVEYIVHAKVHLGDTDGPIVAEGVGSCNTHETKYRFRSAKRTCPDCNVEGLIKGKADGRLKGKWWCPPNSGGCGHTFEPSSEKGQAIDAQVVGQVENENPWDLANTMLKMARKRAGVDGILTATGTSGLFTQDDDSPAVQRDARSGGGDQAGQSSGGRRSSSGAGSTRAALPTIPKGITEPTSVGQVRLSGLVTITDKQRTNGEVRQGKDGSFGGFQFDWNEGGKIATVIVQGPIADRFSEVTQGKPSSVNGVPVIVAGEMFADPWTKKNDEGIEEQMPPARRIVASSIEAEDWKVDSTPAPAPEEAAPAKSKPAAKDKAAEPKQEMVADAVHEAAKTDAPGMTAEAFNRALTDGKVGGSYALSIAKDRYGVEALHALTDPQRLELAAELGLLAEEE